MADDGWLESAATPDGEKLARALDAAEYLESPEGVMFQEASGQLADAFGHVRNALDAFGLPDMNQGRLDLGLRRDSAEHLRYQLRDIVMYAQSMYRVLQVREGRSASSGS